MQIDSEAMNFLVSQGELPYDESIEEWEKRITNE